MSRDLSVTAFSTSTKGHFVTMSIIYPIMIIYYCILKCSSYVMNIQLPCKKLSTSQSISVHEFCPCSQFGMLFLTPDIIDSSWQ